MTINKAFKIVMESPMKINEVKHNDHAIFNLCTTVLKAYQLLYKNDLLDKESIEVMYSVVECKEVLRQKIKAKKWDAKRQKKINHFNQSIWFIISDRQQVLGFGKHLIGLFFKRIEYYINLVIIGCKKDVVDKRIYLIKGTKKASEFLDMNESVFVEKTADMLKTFNSQNA